MMSQRSSRTGFSLIELLVVIAIIGALAGLASVAMSSVLQASHFDHAAQMVIRELEAARNAAISRNRRTEVRFYREAADGPITAIRGFVLNDDASVTPIGRVQRLPSSMEISSNASLSSLFDTGNGAQSLPGSAADGSPTPHSYFAVRFRPDGRTDLPRFLGGQRALWFATIVTSNRPGSGATPPANYWTVQLDPVTGRTTSHRPE